MRTGVASSHRPLARCCAEGVAAGPEKGDAAGAGFSSHCFVAINVVQSQVDSSRFRMGIAWQKHGIA